MSDTVFYITASIVIIHFVAGFVYLAIKLSGPVGQGSPKEEGPMNEEIGAVES